MRGRASLLLAIGATLLLPAAALCAIYEYAGADGKAKFYKYTDKHGVVVFTDRLTAIPEEYRKKNRIVKAGPQSRPAAPAAAAAPAAPEAPAAVAASAEPDKHGPPEVAAGDGSRSLGLVAGVASLLVMIAGAVVVAGRRRASGSPSRRSGSRRTPAAQPKPAAGAGKDPPAASAPEGDALPKKRGEMPEEALRRYLGAWDFVSAAKVCESLGRLDEAARHHLRAGNAARARELYVHLADYQKAAELFEKAGDLRRAAELHEAQFLTLREKAHGSSGRDSALTSGRLFESIGDADRALAVFMNGRCFLEAAAIYLARGDFLNTAECFLHAEDPEKAAEYFARAGMPARRHAVLSRFLYEQGRVKEAAEHAELAGDSVEAATMFQEAGEPAQAGGLFFKAGFFHEAAENFLQAGAAVRAAEAYEFAGRHCEAAQCLEGSGGDPQKIEELYLKSGNSFEVGRFLLNRGEPDRALGALQQVDAVSERYEDASLLVGRLFLEQGSTAQAIEKLTKVIGNRPIDRSTLEPYYFLALGHEAAGDGRTARSIFTKILAEDYNFRDVRERVAGC